MFALDVCVSNSPGGIVCPWVKSMFSCTIPVWLIMVMPSGTNLWMLASWFPGTSTTSHFALTALRNLGTSSHSLLDMPWMVDFTSPSSTSESGPSASIMSDTSSMVWLIVEFFPRKMLFAAMADSNPMWMSDTTRVFFFPSRTRAGLPGMILVCGIKVIPCAYD